MTQLPTVSDAKRAFYQHYTRPINALFRRPLEELLVEMHLLTVNSDFRYDAIYALGMVNSFDRFLADYRPAEDREVLFNALCRAVGGDPATYRRDADTIREAANSLKGTDLLTWLAEPNGNALAGVINSISSASKFKYSRLFGLGIYTIIETVSPEILTDENSRKAAIAKFVEIFKLTGDKLEKDVDSYRMNLEKLAQLKAAMADVLEADRKKREQRERDKENRNLTSSFAECSGKELVG
jgi:photosystem II biogenesis protein Psp29